MPKGSKVLMADDDKMLIDMYKERLELAGYTVILCRNGEEALAKIRETKPDIVLLDIMMPKVNGYEALASIKSDPSTKDIPVIMLSALMRDFNREKAVEAGADDYLIKSEAMPADVITKVEQVLAKYGKGNPAVAAGTVAPNIPAPSATPPISVPSSSGSAPLPDLPVESNPASVSPPPAEPAPAPVAPAMPAESAAQPETAPAPDINLPLNQVIFTPSTSAPAPPKAEEAPKADAVPMVQIIPPNTGPTFLEPKPKEQMAPPSPEVQPPQKSQSPASIVLMVIIAVLLTTLINDIAIYFFFFARK